MQTQFIGENLLPGQIGHLSAIIAVIASLIACIAYAFSTTAKNELDAKSWLKYANVVYAFHFVSIFAIFGILFYLIFNHRYEYYYVWSHSNNILRFKYLLSCFWEGQEGSFLLWLIWHNVLALIVLKTAKNYTAPVMSVICGVQFFISCAILGIYVLDVNIGTSPFMLLRNQMQAAPIFAQANYLEFIKDGNGLNPLLQNYWMVIHPPILFLGFATTLIPFAYSIAGLWKRDFTTWVKPTQAWSIASVAILGTGIMMGGAWAYESLSFGGYWAWDPVENASFVPWLIMVGGLHTLNIYKHSNYSLKSTLAFFMLTFFLVIYSTFLTRTGILGETSVHAFTGEGASLSIHLTIMLAVIAIASFVFYYRNAHIISAPVEEEATWTREFWLFIGALILLISAVQITFTTSIPVWNKLFGLKLAPPADPMSHYNSVQIWIAILIALLMSFVKYLKYKNTPIKEALRAQLIPFIISLILSTAIALIYKINAWQVLVLLVSTIYSIVGNISILQYKKIKTFTKMGSSIAHAGFGLMLLGILISSFNKRTVSLNKLKVKFDLGKKTEAENIKESRENIILFRNTPTEMEDYTLTYRGDSIDKVDHYYKINYVRQDKNTGDTVEDFTLYPYAQINPKMGLVSSPDSKHYLHKDVFTYITSALDKSKIKDTVSYEKQTVKPGDSIFFANGYLLYKGLNLKPQSKYFAPAPGQIAMSAVLEVYNMQGKHSVVEPIYYIDNNLEKKIDDTVHDYSMYVRFAKLNMDANKSVDIEFKQPAAQSDYIILKALEFPQINLVWLGTIIMVIGTFIALYKRLMQKR
jgi:cytochrome c-type biogenesis protein CcmF